MNPELVGYVTVALVGVIAAYLSWALVAWIRAEIAERKWRREKDATNV